MITPRPYISWSQLSLFETSPESYKRAYMHGKRMYINPGMALGKKVATALETGDDTGDPITDLVIAQLPKLDVMEKEIRATIEVGGYKIPLLGKMDTAKNDLSEFKEYKTGTTPWDQKMADKHGQITFYCVIIQALTNRIPKRIELVHAVTKMTPQGQPQLTGEINRFLTTRGTKDILWAKIRMKKAWIGINKLFEDELI